MASRARAGEDRSGESGAGVSGRRAGCRIGASVRRGRGLVLSLGLLLALLPGCIEERDVNYKPFFAGLDGAKFNTPPSAGATASQGEAADPRLVIENPDGSVTLVSRRGLHLMRHIQRTLAEEKPDLFLEQVLSRQTRSQYGARGLDPVQAFDTLKKHEREIARLFSRMPLGEQTPSVIMEKIGRNMFRVRLTGRATEGLQWTFFDMVLEEGQWRLLWLGPVSEPKVRK
jgi:hypothetical protein